MQLVSGPTLTVALQSVVDGLVAESGRSPEGELTNPSHVGDLIETALVCEKLVQDFDRHRVVRPALGAGVGHSDELAGGVKQGLPELPCSMWASLTIIGSLELCSRSAEYLRTRPLLVVNGPPSG